MKRVLVTPLDWGLGHATRCIPVIRELLRRPCEVAIAGSGDSLALLQAEFPSLRSFVIPGYQPRYPRHGGAMVWKMMTQLPKFLSTIAKEHRAIEDLVRELRIDLVISDNRYGCWSAQVPGIFITHQSNILMPKRFGWLAAAVRRRNETYMKRFTRCWLPDLPDDTSLAGSLIDFGKIDGSLAYDYIGHLSRFSPSGSVKKKYDVAAIFSGPEPQRSLLEQTVRPQLMRSGLKYYVVRGLFTSSGHQDDHGADFLSAGELRQVIETSDIIIARSGYSTVMDLSALGKKAIFIPTPGQTEQHYLAQRLMQKGIAFFMEQSRFDLDYALDAAKQFSGFAASPADSQLLSRAIDRALELTTNF